MRRQPRPQAFETGAGFAIEGAPVRNLWTPPGVRAQPHGQPGWWRLWTDPIGRLVRSAPVLIEFDDGMFAAVTALPKFIAAVLRDERGISAVVCRPENAPDRPLKKAWFRKMSCTESERQGCDFVPG